MAFWRFLVSVLISLSSGNEAVITLENRCNTTIWPGFQQILTFVQPRLTAGGFELKPGESTNFPFQSEFVAIWGRTVCSFDSSGQGKCVTGDCNGLLNCEGASPPEPPVTFVVVYQTYNGHSDGYGITLGNGFNIPISIQPYGSATSNCTSASCFMDMDMFCPPELQVRSEGSIIGCKNACLAFDKPEFCCSRVNIGKPYHNPCKPTNYSETFHVACPNATLYDPFNGSGIFSCVRANYLISFC